MACNNGISVVKPEEDCDGNTTNSVHPTLGPLDVDNDPEADKMELAKEGLLREFDILDEFGDDNEENVENSSSCSSYCEDEMEQHSDFQDGSEEEKTSSMQDSKSKKVFDVYDLDDNRPLPPGWVKIIHDSGVPVYLHKETRVCMATRPYYLGADSVRKHKIPASCVPCLQYDKLKAEYVSNSESVGINEEDPLLSSDMLSHYCNKLFRFKTIRVLRFNTWADRRLFTKSRMLSKQDPKVALPLGARIVKIPVDDSNNPTAKGKDFKKKGWVLNPNGKSCVCLLHEYVQHALKKHPTYVFSELENAKTPYSAAVVIDGMQYGVGFGSSKKQAKLEAAKATLEVLIPDLQDKISSEMKVGQASAPKADVSIFDDIKIEDPRVADLCARTTEPYPRNVLLACIKRNFGLEESDIKYQDRSISGGEHEFTIKVGEYCAVVRCHNKRDGKQRTAQAILKQLHPHIDSWGSLLRMYGNCSVKSIKKKREKKQEQIFIQPSEPDHEEDTSILARLKAVVCEAEESSTDLPQYCQRIKEIEELIKQKCQTTAMETAPCDVAEVTDDSVKQELDKPSS